MNGEHILVATLAALGLTTFSGIDEAATTACNLAKIAEWPVRIERNKVIVDGAINGKKVGIVLDTGAERSLILGATATRLGLSTQRTGMRMFGIGGESEVAAARIAEFKIGDTVRKNWLVIVAGERTFGSGLGFILGEDFFSKVDVEFDLAHNMVRLFVPRDCGDAALAYWAAGGVNVVDLDKSDMGRYRILLTVKINGQPVEAMLDSGAATSMLNRADAARLGVTPQSPGVVAAGKGGGLGRNTIDIWSAPFARVSIGDETIRDTTIPIADLWKGSRYIETGSHVPTQLPGTPAMLLGADFLLSHRVLVSQSQRKMYFTYGGGPVFSGGTAKQVPPEDDGPEGPQDPASERAANPSPVE